MKNSIIFLLIIVLLAFGFFLLLQTQEVNAPLKEPPVEEVDEGLNQMQRENTQYGFSYSYDDAYVVSVNTDAVRGDLVFSQFVLDAQEYEALQQSTVPREGPPGLSISVYRNPMNITAEEWIRSNDASNFELSIDGTLASVEKGNTIYTAYTYDGLYRTNAYVYAQDGYIYVFANMWDNASSPVKADMEELLETIVFSEPQILAQVAHGDIVVSSPQAGGSVTSPLTVTGMARGTWFFEASFPLVVVDWNGLIIAEGYAQADGEWMTEEFVPFTGTVEFTKPTFNERGALILQKDNPSGLPENDDAIELPIVFQ